MWTLCKTPLLRLTLCNALSSSYKLSSAAESVHTLMHAVPWSIAKKQKQKQETKMGGRGEYQSFKCNYVISELNLGQSCEKHLWFNFIFSSFLTCSCIHCSAASSSDYSEKFHVTVDGQYLFFPNRRAIRVWDLKHSRMASALLHVNSVSKMLCCYWHLSSFHWHFYSWYCYFFLCLVPQALRVLPFPSLLDRG